MNLADCKEISNAQYCALEGETEFMGQTRVNSEGVYWMTWKHEGILYKTKNQQVVY